MSVIEASRAWRVFPLAALLAGPVQVHGQDLAEEDAAFAREHAPSILRIFEEAKKKEYEEVLEELRERLPDIREEFLEAKEEDGEEWAGIVAAREDNEAAVEFLLWKFEEGEIGEEGGERELRGLMAQRLAIEIRTEKLELREMREEVEELAREAAELEKELEWKENNRKAAVEEMLEEFLEELDGGEEEEHEREDEEEEDDAGALYIPGPKRVEDEESALAALKVEFGRDVRPVLETYCFDCHDAATAKGDLDIESALAARPLVRNRALWENVAERVKNGDMPPEDKPQPEEDERRQVRAWLAKEIDQFDYASVRNPGYLPARRLTREEYNRTIRDLVGLDLRPADEFPMDFSGTSGFSNSANTLFLATAHLDRYLTSAELVIDAVRGKAEAWEDLVAGEDPLSRFVHRAFRRPPSPEELGEVRGRFEAAAKAGKSRDDALADAFKLVLVSPHFLLRVEEGGSAGVDRPVAPHDLATRLSYFLWASTPDEELLAAATRGDVADSAKRRAQVERMLADPRSRALGEIFAGEWLGTDDVGPRIRKDPIDNPWCTESLMAAMRDETALFVHSLVRENAPVARLIDAEYTFLNAELAKFYRIPGVEGDHMRRVELETSRRGGVFGHASVLAATSFPDRTSPVVRGTWILTTLLGTPPPPPPPDVPEIEVEGGSKRAVRTLRARLERHRESKRCAGCHEQIDPLGFALENYAEFGQWRSGVDNEGTLPDGARVRGPAGLKLALVDTRLDDLGTQVIRKMLAYALGRQLEYYDEAVVRGLAAKLNPAGYPLREMVVEIANCYPFTMKRLPEEEKAGAAHQLDSR